MHSGVFVFLEHFCPVVFLTVIWMSDIYMKTDSNLIDLKAKCTQCKRILRNTVTITLSI